MSSEEAKKQDSAIVNDAAFSALSGNTEMAKTAACQYILEFLRANFREQGFALTDQVQVWTLGGQLHVGIPEDSRPKLPEGSPLANLTPDMPPVSLSFEAIKNAKVDFRILLSTLLAERLFKWASADQTNHLRLQQAKSGIEVKCPRMAENPGPFVANDRKYYVQDNETCGYCGSIMPDLFMQMLEDGRVELGSTDKDYKVYVRNTGVDGQIKFYFQHLSPPQMQRFVELYNEKKLKFEAGLGFYVYPFFMRRAATPSEVVE